MYFYIIPLHLVNHTFIYTVLFTIIILPLPPNYWHILFLPTVGHLLVAFGMNQIFSGAHEEMAQLLKSQSLRDLIAGGERSCLNDNQQMCNMEESDSPVTAKCPNFLQRIQFVH